MIISTSSAWQPFSSPSRTGYGRTGTPTRWPGAPPRRSIPGQRVDHQREGTDDDHAVDRVAARRPPSQTPTPRIGCCRTDARPAWSDHLHLGSARCRRSIGRAPGSIAGRRPACSAAAGPAFPTGRKVSAVAAAVAGASCRPSWWRTAARATPRRPRIGCWSRDRRIWSSTARLPPPALGADRVVLAAHEDSPTRLTLAAALAERPAPASRSSWCGVPDRYIASEATALVRFLNTR